jgi:transposase
MPSSLNEATRLAVQRALEAGMQHKAISTRYGISVRQVEKMNRNLKVFGTVANQPTGIQGRPPKLTAQMEAAIVAFLLRNKVALRSEVCEFLRREFEVEVNAVTVGRYLARLHITCTNTTRRGARDGLGFRAGVATTEARNETTRSDQQPGSVTMSIPRGFRPHIQLVLLSGPSGSGKSTLAYEVSARLRTRKVMHCHIDADNLDALYPRTDDSELMLRSLQALWRVWFDAFLDSWARGWANGGTWEGPLKNKGKGKVSAKPASQPRATVIVSGTAVVTEMRAIQEVISLGKEDVRVEMEVQCVPVVLEVDEAVTERRLRGRVLGEELQQHLESSRRWRGRLAEWCEREEDRVWRIRSDRELGEVTDEVMGILDSAALHCEPRSEVESGS